MIDRRDFVFAALCAAGLAGAEALRPRTRIDLLGDLDLSDTIPMKFGAWSAELGGDLVIPQTEDSLAARLYAKQIARSYFHPDLETPVMLLIAYGASQSDALQLHRPEACYPAVGFTIEDRRFSELPIGRGAALPAVDLTARADPRLEDIVYWTRLGEYFPRSAGEQRKDRLAMSMEGYIGDGVLVRASMVRLGEVPQHKAIGEFLAGLLQASAADGRRVLIGTQRSNQLAA